MSSEDVATDIGQQQAEQITPVMQEKMLTQSEVDRIVGAAKAKERAQAEAQYRQHAGSMGGMPAQSFDEEAMIEKAAARMEAKLEEQRQAYEMEQHKKQVEGMVHTYLDKMKQGPALYDDFDEVTKSFSPAKYPQITVFASQMDNTPDIIYELKKNPTKLTHLHVLALTDEDEARAEMLKLSKSIKRNEEALANNTKSPQPLSKLKASTVAGSDTGKRTVRDLRADPRFKV